MEPRFESYIVQKSPPDLNYGLLNITNQSRYSSLMPWHLQQVKNIIQNETRYLTVDSLVDANAHIGVDSILFRLIFPNTDITSIELNPNTYQQLVKNMNNISVIVGHRVKPIQTLNMDCLDYIYNNNYDLIYFDPPWNDSDYKSKQINDLYLSNISLTSIVNSLMGECCVIVKLPYNINIHSFRNQIQCNYFKVYNIYTSNDQKKISYLLAFIQ